MSFLTYLLRRDTVPSPVAFEEDVIASEELTFHLQARFAEIRERIYRPFLFLAIHLPSESYDAQVLDPLVKKHVNAILKLAHQWVVRHRHHGTWFGARQIFTAGLLILAAVKSSRVDVPKGQWAEAVNLVVASLRYWEVEAPDLRVSRMMLQDIIAGVERKEVLGDRDVDADGLLHAVGV